MNVLFITTEGFPSGMAQTNRIMSLARGLVKRGVSVKVLIGRPTERKENQINFQQRGVFDGVDFQYVGGRLVWPKKKACKMLSLLYSILLTIIYLLNNRGNYDAIIISNPRVIVDCLLKMAGGKVKCILAIDEYPVFERELKKFRWYYYKVYKIGYNCYDGVLAMTRVLIKYYKPLTRNNIPFTHIPMTVEVERFINNNEPAPINNNYIAYCGNLGHNEKDGVPILIKSFSRLKNKFKDLKLVIIGGAKPSEEKELLRKLKLLVSDLHIENEVIFTGKISRTEMPKYLNNACLLALARPNSIQAQGGFPTKLGEYLATGNPVVVTKVGEIPFYLEDYVTAYLAEPNNVDDFARKLQEALQNKDASRKIGKNGQALAKNVFNYEKQAKQIIDFLNNITVSS